HGSNEPDCHSWWPQTLIPAPGLKPLGEHTTDLPHYLASSSLPHRRQRSPLLLSSGPSRPRGRMVQVVAPPTEIRVRHKRLWSGERKGLRSNRVRRAHAWLG